jgi:hypothetical protein
LILSPASALAFALVSAREALLTSVIAGLGAARATVAPLALLVNTVAASFAVAVAVLMSVEGDAAASAAVTVCDPVHTTEARAAIVVAGQVMAVLFEDVTASEVSAVVPDVLVATNWYGTTSPSL